MAVQAWVTFRKCHKQVYGGQVYGGQVYGGQVYGGQVYRGQAAVSWASVCCSASLSRPAAAAVVTVPNVLHWPSSPCTMKRCTPQCTSAMCRRAS
jgi:hypothetical protein